MATNDRKSAEQEIDQAVAYQSCLPQQAYRSVAISLAERVSVLERALRGLLEWEREYRTINHLGQTPPQVFRQAEAALGETERNTL